MKKIFTIALILLLSVTIFAAPATKGWSGNDFYVPGTVYADSMDVNNFNTDSLWANWARILKLTDGTATLEGGDLTGLDSLQVLKVGAYTLYGQLSGNQQNITNVNELTADSLTVGIVDGHTLSGDINAGDNDITNINKVDTDTLIVTVLSGNIDGNQVNLTDMNKVLSDTTGIGVFYANVDGNQKNVTDLNKLNTDSTSAFVVDGNLDMNQNNITDANKVSSDTLSAFVAEGNVDLNQKNIVDVNELTADSAAIARLDADSSFLGILGENLDGNQKNITDLNKLNTDSLVAGIVDINGGAIDGTTIGVSSASTGAFSTISSTGQYTNTLAIGTSPFAVISTTVNTNLNADLLDAKSEAAFATLAEAETVSGKYTFSDTLIASKAVKGADGVLLINETATKATLPSNTSWMYPYDDGSSVHLMATKDDAGTETVVKIAEQSSITNLSSKGAVYSFDGVNDAVALSVMSGSDLDFGIGDFSFSFWVKSKSTSNTPIYSAWEDADNRFYIRLIGGRQVLIVGETDNVVRFSYQTTSATAIPLNTWSYISIVGDRDNAIYIYINGKSEPVTANTAMTAGDVDVNAATYIGRYVGESEFANCELSGFIPFNCAITDASERAQIALGNIPAKYQWGSQTSKVTGDDSDFDTNTGNWSGYSGGVWNGVVGDWDGGAGTGFGKFTLETGSVSGIQINVLQAGKPYRFSLKAKLLSGTSIALYGGVGFGDVTYYSEGFTPTGTETTYTGTFMSPLSGGNFNIATPGAGTGQVFIIDDVVVYQLGANAAYSNENFTASTAYDASSNNLDGTVSGATLLNAKVADAFVNPNKAAVDDAVIATVKHSGYDSAGNLDDFVKFETIMQDVTATTEDGGYKISAMVAGTMTNTLEYDGNTGILDIAGALTVASVVSDAQVTATTTVSGATYGSNGSISDAELLYINTLSSNAQDQLNLKAPLANPTFTGSFTSPGIDDNADAIAITIDVTTEKVNFTADTDAGGAASATSFAADANLTGNNTAYASSVKLVYKKTINYNDATGGNIILFDANAIIWSIKVEVTTGWDSATTAKLDIGVTAVATQYQDDLNIKAAGWSLTTTPTVGNRPGATYITYTIVNDGEPSVGVLNIYVEYSLY